MNREKKVADILMALHSAPLQPERWGEALRLLADFNGVSQIALIEHHVPEDRHQIFAFCGDQLKEGGKLYERHYWRHDEWTKRVVQSPRISGVFRGEDLWPQHLFRRSTFLNEFLSKFEVSQIAGIATSTATDYIEALSLYRGPEEEPFSEEQIDNLRMLAPHVNVALTIRRRLAESESRRSTLEFVFENWSTAAVLLNRAGKALTINRQARLIFNAKGGPFTSIANLEVRNTGDNGQLRAAIHRATSGSDAAPPIASTVLITRRNSSPLHLTITPVSGEVSYLPSAGSAIMLIWDPDTSRNIPSELLRELYHLTPAEIRLALLLLAGSSLPEAADSLSVSRETVRSQLKTILHKTGRRGQTDLIRLLVGISGTLPAES